MKRAALLVVALALCAGPSLLAQRVQRRVFVTGDGRERHADPQPQPSGNSSCSRTASAREVVRATRFGGPLRIALVVDSSSAVAPLLNNLRAGLTTFLDELPGEHEITFISTGGQIRIRQPVTTDRKKLKTAVGAFASDGGANSVIETMMEVDQRFLKGAARPVAGPRHRHHGPRRHALGTELRSVQPVRRRISSRAAAPRTRSSCTAKPAASPPSS